MNGFVDISSIPVELGMHSEMRGGYISCPPYLRLLDLFNGDSYDNPNFIELNSSPIVDSNENTPICFHKSVVELVAVSEANIARGLGSDSRLRTYPFVFKNTVRVNLQLHSYTLVGTLHLSETQTIRELLNEKSLFLPMTDVSISHNFRF
jgi:hypothetical protein